VILYGYWRSTCSWRVRIALALKGIAYRTEPVHLVNDGGEQHREGYDALNPMRQVPLLIVEEAEGTLRIGQSMAIIEYLEETHPVPALLPGSPAARALVRQMAEIVNSGIQPLQNLAVLRELGRVAPEADKQAWARHFIAQGLAALERLAQEHAGRYLAGDAPTLADVYLVPQLYNGRRFGLELEAYPALLGIEARCEALEAFQSAHPSRQPDAEG
jgi:maleylpyruvate isomerase